MMIGVMMALCPHMRERVVLNSRLIIRDTNGHSSWCNLLLLFFKREASYRLL
jgi:hypothetical protein